MIAQHFASEELCVQIHVRITFKNFTHLNPSTGFPKKGGIVITGGIGGTACLKRKREEEPNTGQKLSRRHDREKAQQHRLAPALRDSSAELGRAPSRLYRSHILKANMRLKALAEIYAMHSFCTAPEKRTTGKKRRRTAL